MGDMPFADYDELSMDELQARLPGLSSEQLRAVLAHERAHADRQPVKQLIVAALDRPSGGEGPAGTPRPHVEHRAGSPVSPESAGSPVHPPPHGEPAQPAKPKADRR